LKVKENRYLFCPVSPICLKSVNSDGPEILKRYISGIDILLSNLHTRSGYTTNVEYLMKITELANVTSGPTPHPVDVRRIYESPHAMAVVITLEPGDSLKRQSTRLMYFFSSWKDPVLVKLPMRNRLLEKTCW
jgi:hypothetical protein